MIGIFIMIFRTCLFHILYNVNSHDAINTCLKKVQTSKCKVYDIKLLVLQGYDIKKGQTMILSPYWAHRDPEVYPEPNVYKPERWEGIHIESLSYRHGFLVFGGGRWQCPGR